MTPRPAGRGRKLALGLVIAIALLATVEGGLRVWAGYFRHSYQRFDPSAGMIRLVAGYDREIYGGRIRVNAEGFRGTEFEVPKPPGVYRIFALGDSTTFGLAGDNCPYPVQLERRLNQASARRFEVVNAGVEGYNSRDALAVLEREVFRYAPDMITIYIGWNDLMKHDPGNPAASPRFARLAYALYDVYLVKLWRKVMFAWARRALLPVETELSPAAAQRYAGYTPQVFRENVARMIDDARARGVAVVLITLPSPLRPVMPPEEVKKLYFPYYTQNLKTLYLVYTKYNDTIRALGREKRVPVLDLQAALEGRSDLFFDTAHMECEGHGVVADELFDMLRHLGVVRAQARRLAGGSR